MPVDTSKIELPVGHYMNYRQQGTWSLGSICQDDSHIHTVEQHTGENPCTCNIHLVIISAPPTE